MKKYIIKKIQQLSTKIIKNSLYEIAQDLGLMEKIIASVESSHYLKKMPGAKRFVRNDEFLQYCCEINSNQGCILEFGVFKGNSIKIISKSLPKLKVFGFDSFEGLPEDWRPGFEKGTFDLKGNIPKVPDNVSLIHGWFDVSLPEWLKENNEEISLIHVDCDLYSSTITIFNNLSNKIKKGQIIVFDEYFNYPGWEDGEYKAFHEFCMREKINYEYVAVNMMHEQVAVRIL